MGWQDSLKLDNQNMKWHAYKRIHATAVHSVASCCHEATDLDNSSLSTQEELLLSILPKHIADEMLQGMKDQAQQQEVQQQFNTMYMYRHENVRSEYLFFFITETW